MRNLILLLALLMFSCSSLTELNQNRPGVGQYMSTAMRYIDSLDSHDYNTAYSGDWIVQYDDLGYIGMAFRSLNETERQSIRKYLKADTLHFEGERYEVKDNLLIVTPLK